MCITFSKEKKFIAEMKPDMFDEHVKNIFNPSADADAEKADKTNADAEKAKKVKVDPKLLIKFYFDEITGKKLIKEGPSLGNACKAILRRDQRFIMYIIVLLLIPV